MEKKFTKWLVAFALCGVVAALFLLGNLIYRDILDQQQQPQFYPVAPMPFFGSNIEATSFNNLEIYKVYDGDTFTADLQVWRDFWLHGQKFRLYGINAPEVRGYQRQAGLVSRDSLRSWVNNTCSYGEILGKDKYGRWLVQLWHNGVNMNDKLVSHNLAVYRQY